MLSYLVFYRLIISLLRWAFSNYNILPVDAATAITAFAVGMIGNLYSVFTNHAAIIPVLAGAFLLSMAQHTQHTHR